MSLLFRILTTILLPLCITSTVYLYFYPVFHGCAFPLPHEATTTITTSSSSGSGFLRFYRNNAYFDTWARHLRSTASDRNEANDGDWDTRAPFRLLVLADPQLEGDSSLPDPEEELIPRLRVHWAAITRALRSSLSSSTLLGQGTLGDTELEQESAQEPEPEQDQDQDDDEDEDETLFATITNILRSLTTEDIPRAVFAARKRIDLVGNDYYLAHIYRTLNWWSRPTHITVLGDLIGSQWVTDGEFEERGSRYWKRVFKGGKRVDDEITVTGSSVALSAGESEGSSMAAKVEKVYDLKDPSWTRRVINVAGNHDIGYAGDVSRARLDRFERVFGRANWDVRFEYNMNMNLTSNDTHTGKPTLHLINLNTLTLDTPALSPEIQTQTYNYVNDIISHRSYPVEDRTTFTLLLTHLPLHKSEGICTDAPHFAFFDSDDEDGGPADGLPRFNAGGLREQNHLSDHVSAQGILQGIFGMSGDEETSAAGGRGRNGLILTGHDHTGCDVVHYVERRREDKQLEADGSTIDGDGEEQGQKKMEEEEEQKPWKWKAKQFQPNGRHAVETTPSIREITLRSMMGEFGGNAGLLSLWFDSGPEVNEWRYEITMCKAGVQHIWWAVHIVALLTCVWAALWMVVSARDVLRSSGSETTLQQPNGGKQLESKSNLKQGKGAPGRDKEGKKGPPVSPQEVKR